MFANTFFTTINIIGPNNSPITPINLKPVYIEINVNIGCIPICFDTNLGSINCLIILIIIKRIIIAIPKSMSPFNAVIIAHGSMIVPDPNIGRASTNPINIAIKSGYAMLNPAIFNIDRPIKDIINDTITSTIWAFK